jgi:hypothetical protein
VIQKEVGGLYDDEDADEETWDDDDIEHDSELQESEELEE